VAREAGANRGILVVKEDGPVVAASAPGDEGWAQVCGAVRRGGSACAAARAPVLGSIRSRSR